MRAPRITTAFSILVCAAATDSGEDGQHDSDHFQRTGRNTSAAERKRTGLGSGDHVDG